MIGLLRSDVFFEIETLDNTTKTIIRDITWEVGIENLMVISPLIFSKDAFFLQNASTNCEKYRVDRSGKEIYMKERSPDPFLHVLLCPLGKDVITNT